jgi:hypothetical protein
MHYQKMKCQKCGREVGVRKNGTLVAHKPRKGSSSHIPCKG